MKLVSQALDTARKLTAKRICILHIGTMKTGTTSIQRWMRDNTEWLDAQGWEYLGWPMRKPDEIAERVKAAQPEHNLIISDEGLWHAGPTIHSKNIEIAHILREYKVKVIVYFRRPDVFAESWFKQALKKGDGEQNANVALASSAISCETFKQRLDSFVKVFGKKNVIVAPYERSQMKNNDVLDDFLMRTGIPVPPPEMVDAENAPVDRNISPSADVILMAGLMRNIFNMKQDQISRMLYAKPVPALTEARTSVLTLAEAERIRRDFRPFYRYVQKNFRTGVEPDFFNDWADDDAPPPVSTLRGVYDRYMAEYTSRAGTPAE